MLRIDEGLLDKNWRPSQKTVVETKVSRTWCSGYICVLSCLAFIYNQHHENDINSIFQLPHLGAPCNTPQVCGLALRTLGPAFDSILRTCVATATAYDASTFSFAIGTLFFITVILFWCLGVVKMRVWINIHLTIRLARNVSIHLAQVISHKLSVLDESDWRSFDSMAANLIVKSLIFIIIDSW